LGAKVFPRTNALNKKGGGKMKDKKLPEGYRWGHDRKDGEKPSNAPAYGDKIHEGDKPYKVEEIHYRNEESEGHPKEKEIKRIKRG